jgi:hypothetical protein
MNMLVRLCAFVCLLGASALAEVSFFLTKDGRSFVAAGASDSDKLRVHVEGDGDLPAMAGEVSLIKNGLLFKPQFPLTPGVRYRVSVGGAHETFAIPEADKTPVARVAAVFPSADILPENLLKFYLHFTEPMAIGEMSQHVHLIGRGGKIVALPFLELAEELWDPEGQRLTLFFDPGRVKRGLKPHEEEGRALVAGEDYELRIDAAWRDAKGRSMASGFSKKFRAGPADYTQPEPKDWTVEPPALGSREGVRMNFGEALDHGLLERVLKVYDSNGQALAGEITVGKGEKEWHWKPETVLGTGSYKIVVESILEDLAGNSVARLFEEVDGMTETWVAPGLRLIRVPFVVKD